MTPVDSLFEREFSFLLRQTGNQKVSTSSALVSHFEEKISSQDYDQYHVSRVFYPIILASKWLGFCPVAILKRDNSSIHYEFKRFSRSCLFSYIFVLLYGFLVITWQLNSIFDVDFPIRLFPPKDFKQQDWLNPDLIKSSHLVTTLNNLIKCSLPLGAWMSQVLSWGDISSLCCFLNAWADFISHYQAVFSPYYKVQFSLTRFRNGSVAFWLTPIFILFVVLRPVSIIENVDPVIGLVLAYVQMCLMLGTRSLSYVKDFMLLKIIHDAYSETLNGMKAKYAKCGKSITKLQVREWMNLISFIRKQTNRLQSYLSLHCLWSVFEIFATVLLILSLSVFLFINDTYGEVLESNFLSYSLVCTGFFICSLYWKTEIVERIASVEEEIGETLLIMHTNDEEFDTRLEMKLICDVVYNDPVRIQLGNILTLNKKLLVAFSTQLASYLVVILQFSK